LNLPNLISLGRIILAVLLFPLLFVDEFGLRMLAFVVFLVAAFSDLWDGYLARSRGLVTDLGKLLDPLADKLLLGSTFLAFYFLSHWAQTESPFPWFGGVFPLWIMLVIFGREIFITVFRSYAARRGVVIPAGPAGKYKTVFQNIFIGAAILWYALDAAARARQWSGATWETWQTVLFTVSVVTLSIAVVLTIYSMLVYLWGYRTLVAGGEPEAR
jgi:CDP-diacylglycerol---glycerol-3-phosphate 3-phosphatidyltransferase